MGAKHKPSKLQSHLPLLRKNSMKPSIEFQSLKNRIESQLTQKISSPPPHAASNLTKNSTRNFSTSSKIPLNINLHSPSTINGQFKHVSLDSLGGSAFTTDQSSNIASLSSSTSSIGKKNEARTLEKPKIAPKPKLIDLEFKNELERLFSANDNESKKFQRGQHLRFMPAHEKPPANILDNDKLRNIFELITGNLISDYSELLVDCNDNSNDTIVSNNNVLVPKNLLKSSDNDKLVQFLIQILVKSCRVFDVATTVSSSNLSFWRYANPIVAAHRQSSNGQRQIAQLTFTNSSTQTNFDINQSSYTTTTNTDQETVIEAKCNSKMNASVTRDDSVTLAQSIMELLSDSLSFNKNRISYRLKKFHLTKKDVRDQQDDGDELSSSNFHYTCFSGSVSSDSDVENMFIDLDEEDFTDSLTTTTSTSNIPSLKCPNKYSSIHRPIRKISKGHKANYARAIQNYEFNRNFLNHFNLYEHRKTRSIFMHSSRAQDETLRDAENISDIDDDELDEVWADLASNVEKSSGSLESKRQALVRSPADTYLNSNLINKNISKEKKHFDNINNNAKLLLLMNKATTIQNNKITNHSHHSKKKKLRKKVFPHKKTQNYHHHHHHQQKKKRNHLRKITLNNNNNKDECTESETGNKKMKNILKLEHARPKRQPPITNNINKNISFDHYHSRFKDHNNHNKFSKHSNRSSSISISSTRFNKPYRSRRTRKNLLKLLNKASPLNILPHLHSTATRIRFPRIQMNNQAVANTWTVQRTNSIDSLEDDSNGTNSGSTDVPVKFDKDIIKQRTRECLKFWQNEEEKLKLTDSPAMKFNYQSHNNSISSSIASTSKVSSLKTATVSSIPSHYCSDTASSPTESVSRVQDRINVFETKKKENIGSHGLSKPSFIIKPVVSTKKFPLIELKETETITKVINKKSSEQRSDMHFETYLPKFKTNRIESSRSIGSDLNKVGNFSMIKTAKSSSTLQSDLKMAQVVPIKSFEQAESLHESSGSSEIVLHKSTTNLEKVNSSSSLEMDEVEIIIQVDSYNELKKVEMANERLKNIVMHMIPTTRKAYVDDICDGIKSLLDESDIIDIKSPVDLPNSVVKYVQKRYSSLLNEYDSMSVSNEPVEMQKQIQTEENKGVTTTELTMVKEIQFDSNSEHSENENYVKVDEDTLYIVEKKLTGMNYNIIPVTADEPTPTVAVNNTDVDKEIRKNFELKAKSDELFTSNVSSLVNALRNSIEDNKFNSEINDFQLHFFNIGKKEMERTPCLVIFIDTKNQANHKFTLEQKYHKSIVETHALNNKKEINIVADLNVFFTCDSHEDTFRSFSLISPPKSKEDIQSISVRKVFNSFPIGKYFAKLNYISKTDTKELLIDISLLPLAIRATFAFEFESLIELETHEYPTFNLMVLDQGLVQFEKDQLRKKLFNKRFEQFNEITPDVKHAVMSNPDRFLEKIKSVPISNSYIDQFVKQLDIDLNSFYLCEQTVCTNVDLIKINKLDALAAFDCAQYFEDIFREFIDHNSTLQGLANLCTCTKSNETSLDEKIFQTHGNRFFIVDNGKMYRCLVPITDLPISQDSQMYQKNEEFVKSVENLQHNSSLIIENVHKRENFIYSRHLLNVAPFKTYGSMSSLLMNMDEKIHCVKLKLQSADECDDDTSLFPSCSESVSLETSHMKHRASSKCELSDIKSENEYEDEKTQKGIYNSIHTYETEFPRYDDELETQYSDINDQVTKIQEETLNQNQEDAGNSIKFASFETDRLKLSTVETQNNASVDDSSVNSRDEVIIKEIDRMFASIRDHQGSNAKCKSDEMPRFKKRSGSWGYSSSKRHVKAKVMELPFAEQYASVVENTSYVDEYGEKVFVRIDDYLNQDVSRAVQRSYSMDYLNKCAGPRIRIRYVKIPEHLSKSKVNYELEQEQRVKPISNLEQLNTEYRSAPYDMRYWSIIKLLEKEQQQQKSNSYQINQNTYESIPMRQKMQSNNMQEFMPMNDIETEIKSIHNDLSNTSSNVAADTKPKYIIKEKTTPVKKAVLKKIDDELKKIEQERAKPAKSNKNFGFKIIDKLFGKHTDKVHIGAETTKSSKKSIDHYMSQQSVYLNAYNQLPMRRDSKSSGQDQSHATLVSKLQNLLPSNSASDRPTKMNY